MSQRFFGIDKADINWLWANDGKEVGSFDCFEFKIVTALTNILILDYIGIVFVFIVDTSWKRHLYFFIFLVVDVFDEDINWSRFLQV